MSEQKFEPFQRVLARYCKGDPWIAVFYGHKTDHGHLCGTSYMEDCIPYEGNEYLLGTTKDPKPKWQPKPGELVAVTDSLEEKWKVRMFHSRNEGLFFCHHESLAELQGWLFCAPLRKYFIVPEK